MNPRKESRRAAVEAPAAEPSHASTVPADLPSQLSADQPLLEGTEPAADQPLLEGTLLEGTVPAAGQPLLEGTVVVLGQNHKEAGEHLLQTLIQTFPDNKIVEDVHNALRLEARGNKNNKLTPSTMQSVCMNSGVLESRGISHQAEVSESEFIQALGSVKRVKEMYFSKVHVLPEEYISICSTRSWSAFTEESLETGTAAWAWLQFQSQTLSVFGNLKATSGVFSKVARRGLVFQLEDTVSSRPQFSLGHADWGVLMWPLELCDSDDEVEYYTLQCDVEAKAKCEFLHDPQEWKVVDMEPV